MKKIGVLLLTLVLVVSLALSVSSQENNNETEETIDEKARSCLRDRVDDCSRLSHEETVFSLLGLAGNYNVQENCFEELGDEICWPAGDCNVKDTALAAITFDYFNKDTEEIREWIKNQSHISEDLEWFFEIDSEDLESGENTVCSIDYGEEEMAEVTVNYDRITNIDEDPENCFSHSFSNYWLRIDNDCLDREFEFSCDEDFLTSSIYRRKDSNVWRILDMAKSASADGRTIHEINSYCLGVDECYYEDTLWGGLLLSKIGDDVSEYLPYLISLKENNDELFPSTFLHSIEGSDKYLREINSLRRNGYWDESKNEFYSTALALMTIPSSQAREEAKKWLEEEKDSSGCWNNENIIDTGFLLWAGWPTVPAEEEKEKDEPPKPTRKCEEEDGYCLHPSECDDAGGNELEGLDCEVYGEICCSQPVEEEKSCSRKGGEICGGDEECTGDMVGASDTDNCCVDGSCVPKATECEEEENICRTSCLEGEEIAGYDCHGNDVCCEEIIEDPDPEGGYWWIWVLIILIILLVLGIIFRHKLRAFLFKGKGKGKSKPPRGPGPGQRPMNRPRPGMSPKRRPPRSSRGQTDKELSDTMDKLKNMQ